jgi:hypothetical protein
MPDGAGNETQVRAVAEQLFSTWAAKQELENKRRNLIYGSLPAWIACILSVIAVLWQAAITTQRVNENTRRVEQLEILQREQDRSDKATIQQLARIEAKVDLVIGERSRGQ